jgi:hypothetical protein
VAATAAVVVRVQADRDVLAVLDVATEPLDLVGVGVRRGHLDRGGQVEDDLAAVLGLPDVHDRVADLDAELQLGAGEDLGAVLVAERGAGHVLLGVLHDQLGAAGGDGAHLVLRGVEDDATEQRRDGVVEVDVGAPGAGQRLRGPLDEVLAGLGQDRDRDVVGDDVLLDQRAHEREVGLAGRREPDLDLLVAHAHEQLEHAALAHRGHGVDEGLVAVAQVGGQPARGLRDGLGRPGAVGQVDGRERAVAAERHRRRLLRRDDVAGQSGAVRGHVGVFLGVLVRSLRSVHDELRAEGPDLVDLDAAEKESARVHRGQPTPRSSGTTTLQRWAGSDRLGS